MEVKWTYGPEEQIVFKKRNLQMNICIVFMSGKTVSTKKRHACKIFSPLVTRDKLSSGISSIPLLPHSANKLWGCQL